MKKLSLTLALCLAASPLLAEAPPTTPKNAFVEGLVAGVVIGVAGGIVIIIGVRQIQRHYNDRVDSRPDWTYPPWIPPSTNAPPGTNVAKMLLDAGPAMPQYDISALGLEDPNAVWPADRGFVTALQVSDDATNWTTLYRVAGWSSDFGSLAVLSDADWHPIATNYAFGTWNSLEAPIAGASARFYRATDP